MRKRVLASFLAGLLCVAPLVWAETPTDAGYGTIHAKLDRVLSTATAKVGDHFTLTTTEAVRQKGKVVIPAGSKITAEITEVKQAKRASFVGSRQAKLNFRFQSVRLKRGSVPLAATLANVMEPGASKSKVKTTGEGEVQAKQDTKKSALKLGGGSVGGLIIGAATGHLLAGFLIGTLAGGGWVTASKGRPVELPAGTQFELRLDRPVGSTR